MSATENLVLQRKYDLLIPFLSSIIIVLFFSYIDEGYYDFRWMTDPGSWLAFGIYLAVFFALLSLVYNFGLTFLKGTTKNLVMLGVIPPGLIFLILWLVS